MKVFLLVVGFAFFAPSAQAARVISHPNLIAIQDQANDDEGSRFAEAMRRAGLPATVETYDGQDVIVRRMNNVVSKGSEVLIQLHDPSDLRGTELGHLGNKPYHVLAVGGNSARDLAAVNAKLRSIAGQQPDLSLTCRQDKNEELRCFVFHWL